MREQSIIGIENLFRRTREGQTLLHPTSLDVCAGDRLGIVGESGSGKTLLLRSLAALDPIQGGTLVFHNEEVLDRHIPNYRRDVIYLPQRPFLMEGSVETNLRMPFSLKTNKSRKFNRTKIENWLDQIGKSATFLEKDKDNLSGGEMQIVALLRAIELDPKILLLDEPTASLDESLTTSVERFVTDWFHQSKRGVGWVWITHSKEQAKRVCKTVYRMQAGRLLHDNGTGG